MIGRLYWQEAIALILCLLVIASIVIPMACLFFKEIYKITLRYEREDATVVVLRKKYVEEYNSTVVTRIGKSSYSEMRHHSAEFWVYLSYEGKEYEFNNEELYGTVNEGDNVKVTVNRGFNERNELRDVYLSLS